MTQIAILVIIGIIYLIFKIFEGISDAFSSSQDNRKVLEERNEKFGNRQIDTSKSLFERNLDIIQSYANKINADSYLYYYLDNQTRDCINEICLAENQMSIKPGHAYLSTWENTAPQEWVTLSIQIKNYFRDEQNRLKDEGREINKAQSDFEKIISAKKSPKKFREINKRSGHGDIYLEQVNSILILSTQTWHDKEQLLIKKQFIPQHFPFPSESTTFAGEVFNKKITAFNQEIERETAEHQKNAKFFEKLRKGFSKKSKPEVVARIDYILNEIKFPTSFPKLWDSDYDSEQSILIVEMGLPDVVHSQILKKVELKTKTVDKPLTKKEIQEFVPKIHPAIILRLAYEIFRNDDAETIKLLVVNGWVEYDNPATGVKTKTYTSSLVCSREQILSLNLTKLDPLAAFLNLKGKSAGALIDIIPVTPTMSLNKKDKRFIETKEVLENLEGETNLASMDWQDFENLIAELFEKEFAEKGAEVKVTQSSRDRGVDAVIFDPDPIKGGKFVVQAKRYTKTVDVSAVRDLCAVVKKEGASRGILVTTSSYGSDAYTFAQNEPVTLLNGSELLGLLEKHGYKFRINIAEARKLLKQEQK
ncbi:restriction endonuclease [Candidatus Peregrinibacteria bacterium]|nr:MAG: restriction endonuclease [Candidatus Peregrinibacteria bacterium]